MALPNPATDGFWRRRILTEEELKEVIAAAEAYDEQQNQKAQVFREQKERFLAAMLEAGFGSGSPEYRYVSSRVKYCKKHWSLASEVRRVQEDLRRKQQEEQRRRQEEQEKAERQKARTAKLIEQAKQLEIDPLAYFGDEEGLRKAIRAALWAKLDQSLESAPYYVKASFYGHCLRGDWSNGCNSYGCEELQDLDIPPEDPERPEIHALAKELQEIADEWDGVDGRDFRDTYNRLDALLSEDELALLEFLDDARSQLDDGV